MRVEDIGEFDLINVLIGLIERRGLDRPAPDGHRLRIGLGDDAAAWERQAGVDVFTNDVLVEGIHFDLASTGWRDLGWKSMAVNLSDVAAMGCMPVCAVIGLGLPYGLRESDLVEMYEGMLDACERYGCALVGGDVVRSPTFFVSVAVTGAAQGDGDDPASQPLLARHGARVGDFVAVTGHLGCSAGGLRMMAERRKLDGETAAHLRLAHVRPEPRLAEGTGRGRSPGTALTPPLTSATGCWMTSASCAAPAASAPSSWRNDCPRTPSCAPPTRTTGHCWSSREAEDYELLTAATVDTLEKVGREGGAPLSVIGEIVPRDDGVRVVDESGQPIIVDTGGWDHFRSR